VVILVKKNHIKAVVKLANLNHRTKKNSVFTGRFANILRYEKKANE
jgi:hypothetical protein